MRAMGLILLLGTISCVAQTRSTVHATAVPDSKAESLVSCSALLYSTTQATSHYDFAQATLASLWYARNAAERGNEIKKAGKDSENFFSLITAMLRITKTSTNDFVCAKRSIQPFAVKRSTGNIRTASSFMMVVYDAHIDINRRVINLLMKLGTTDQAQLMDQLSTLQVERDQRWADLVEPTYMALILYGLDLAD